MTEKITEATLAAVKWLINRGGDGVFAEKNHVVLMARGDRCGVMRSTWNKCVRLELCHAYGTGRLMVLAAGYDAVEAEDARRQRLKLPQLQEADCSEVDRV